jgi:sugar/nucleoside kinase (ribokinase family)
MSNHLNTVVAGHLCLDIIPNMDQIPSGEFLRHFQPGRLINIGPALFSTGGPVSNTGLALHILGIPTHLMGKVGKDAFGEAVQSNIRKFGEDLLSGMIIDQHDSTSYTVIINPPGMDRIFLHHTGANDSFGPEDLQIEDIKRAALFHFGYPPLMRRMYENSGKDLVEIFRKVKSTGVTTSLDFSLPDPASPSGRAPWKEILGKVFPYVDIFTPSIEELLVSFYPEHLSKLVKNAPFEGITNLIEPDLLSELSSDLIRRGIKMVLIKLGERGAYLRTGDHQNLEKMGRARPENLIDWESFEGWAPCFQVDVVGTTGSGDSTIAGFLSGLLRGYSPINTLTAAVAVGACNCEAADALGGLRSWENTLQRIHQGWTRKPLDLSRSTWTWSKESEIWLKRTTQ